MFEIHRLRPSQRGMQSSCYRRLIYFLQLSDVEASIVIKPEIVSELQPVETVRSHG
jgi:hypothetical protein